MSETQAKWVKKTVPEKYQLFDMLSAQIDRKLA